MTEPRDDPFEGPFAIILRPLGGRVPARHRVKSLLKELARRGFVCTGLSGPEFTWDGKTVEEFAGDDEGE